MNAFLEWLRALRPETAMMWFFVENVGVFVLAIAAGYALLFLFGKRRVALAPEGFESREIFCTISTILLNTLVTFVGWILWKNGVIVFRDDWSWRIVFDVALLFFAMDAAMYFLHRAAHFARIFPLVHRTHHHYDRPHPISLFVLNPIEALSFGALWLALVAVYNASWAGMGIYLALNVIFGMIGHLGVEPFPDAWKKWRWMNLLSTSTFHAQHHGDLEHNFGFYTLIWDKIFGTLSPCYESDFGRLPSEK